MDLYGDRSKRSKEREGVLAFVKPMNYHLTNNIQGGRGGGKRVGLLGSPEIYHEVRLTLHFHYDIIHGEERKTSKSANVIGDGEH